MEHVQVVGIHADPASAATVVLLGDPDALTRVLPIFIGPVEARAIALGLAGRSAPRPGTHQLLSDVIDAADAQLDRIAVTELVEGTFIARLELTTPWGPRTVSARPSDAIALAVRTGAPVVVAEAVLDEAAVAVDHEPDAPFSDDDIETIVEDFQDLLASASVADFELEDDAGDDEGNDDRPGDDLGG